MTDSMGELRIYVADLAAYNNGKLHGVWVDATLDASDMQDQINEMLKSSPKRMRRSGRCMTMRGFVAIGLVSMKDWNPFARLPVL